MQRNVLYSPVARFALGIIVIFFLTSCAGSPAWEEETPAPPKTASVPTTPSPSLTTPVPVPTDSKNKVALLVPMTGRGSDAGQAMLNAAQLAMFDLGADAFELIPEDTGSSAGFVARDAIGKGAKMIIGPLFASDTKAASPVAMQSGVNVISFSTDTSVASPNTFILGFLPQSQVNQVLEYAGNHGLTRIALIAPHDAYGDAVADIFTKSLAQRSLTNSGVLRYDGSQPAAEQVSQFAKSNAFNAVLIAANISESSYIAQSLPANVRKLGTGLWDQADGSKYPSLKGAWYAASSPTLRAKFENKYRATYGTTPPRLASLAYDAAALAVVLSRQGRGFDRGQLVNPNGFSGIDGIFRFMPDGTNERGLAVMQIGDGPVNIIQDAPTNFR